MAGSSSSFQLVATERHFEIDELDEVVLAHTVETAEGASIPAGSIGTVVAVWAAGEAYEVEFDQPFYALATVARDAISDHRRAA